MRRKNDYHPLLVPAAAGVCLNDGAGSNGVQIGGADMTRDDIIRMALEAGMVLIDDEYTLVLFLEKFAALVVAAERERIKAERQSHIYSKPLYTNGCPVCGLGADGKATGYVCSRGDCPTRITCGGTV